MNHTTIIEHYISFSLKWFEHHFTYNASMQQQAFLDMFISPKVAYLLLAWADNHRLTFLEGATD